MDDDAKVDAHSGVYSEQFERVCPFYMSIGMSYDEFWNGDNELPKMYRKAHKLKLREANQLAWLQGAYVYAAISDLAPALKAFSKATPRKYMEKPFGLDDEEETPKRESKPNVKSNKNAKTWIEMWAINFNEKFDKKEKETKGGEVNGRCAGAGN